MKHYTFDSLKTKRQDQPKMNLKYIFEIIIATTFCKVTTSQDGNYIEKIIQKQIDGYDCSNPIYLASF